MADEEEIVETESEGETEPAETDEPTVGGDGNPNSTESSSGGGTGSPTTSTTTSRKLPMPDTQQGYVDVAPYVFVDEYGNPHFQNIEKPGSRQLRVNAKGVTGSWTAIKFPYKWVEEDIPAGTYPGQSGKWPVIGTLLPKQGNIWSLNYSYCRCQDIEFKEVENGLCEATINYTSDGFTGDMQIEAQADTFNYSMPYQYKWEQTTASSSATQNPYVEEFEIKRPIIDYTVTYTSPDFSMNGYTYVNYMAYITGATHALNCVNASTFHTFGPEQVLCTSLSFTPDFALGGKLLHITVKAGFKAFIDEGFTWQYEWMKTPTLKSPKGADMVWHDLPNQPFPEGAFYTTDQYKKGCKVFTTDVTITNNNDGSITITPNSGEPIHGAFLKPYVYETSESSEIKHYAHPTCDFVYTLGIPPIPLQQQNNNSSSS